MKLRKGRRQSRYIMAQGIRLLMLVLLVLGRGTLHAGDKPPTCGDGAKHCQRLSGRPPGTFNGSGGTKTRFRQERSKIRVTTRPKVPEQLRIGSKEWAHSLHPRANRTGGCFGWCLRRR